jgi:hypothetical protein
VSHSNAANELDYWHVALNKRWILVLDCFDSN